MNEEFDIIETFCLKKLKIFLKGTCTLLMFIHINAKYMCRVLHTCNEKYMCRILHAYSEKYMTFCVAFYTRTTKNICVLCGQQRLEPEFSYEFLFINNLFSSKLILTDRTHFDAPETV